MTKMLDGFGRMMATMDRDVASSVTRRFLAKRPRETRHFFGFLACNAIEWITENEKTGPAEAVRLLNKYIEARLLHCPDDRVCLEVTSDVIELQPTAKGLAFVEEWFRGNMKTVSEGQRAFLVTALSSPYNSMELIRLERGLLSGTPLVSTGLAMWLWRKMLGERPHLFNGTIRKSDKETMRREPLTVFNPNCLDVMEVLSQTSADVVSVRTPYWSSAMIHPSTSSTMQYWDSQGIRLFESLVFERPLASKFVAAEQYAVPMCISGKAMWQWVMECTTAEKPSEAARIVKLFIDQKFIEPFSDRLVSWATYKDNFPKHVSRLTFYRFTQRGMRLCPWESLVDEAVLKPSSLDHDEENAIRWMLSGGPTIAERADSCIWAWSYVDKPMSDGLEETFRHLVTLDLINCEPGLKIPFRRKLIEWHCDETLRYLEDSQRVLLLLKASRSAKGTVTRLKSLQTQVREDASSLKRLYVEQGSPFELNIGQELREHFLEQFKHDDAELLLNGIQSPIEQIQTECMLLLRDQVSRFLVEDDDLRALPLGAYIVGSYRM